jgi:hypothetical protein
LDFLGTTPIIFVAGLGMPIFLTQRLADLFAGWIRTKELAMAGSWIGYEPAITGQTSAPFSAGGSAFHGAHHGWLRRRESPAKRNNLLRHRDAASAFNHDTIQFTPH